MELKIVFFFLISQFSCFAKSVFSQFIITDRMLHVWDVLFSFDFMFSVCYKNHERDSSIRKVVAQFISIKKGFPRSFGIKKCMNISTTSIRVRLREKLRLDAFTSHSNNFNNWTQINFYLVRQWKCFMKINMIFFGS